MDQSVYFDCDDDDDDDFTDVHSTSPNAELVPGFHVRLSLLGHLTASLLDDSLDIGAGSSYPSLMFEAQDALIEMHAAPAVSSSKPLRGGMEGNVTVKSVGISAFCHDGMNLSGSHGGAGAGTEGGQALKRVELLSLIGSPHALALSVEVNPTKQHMACDLNLDCPRLNFALPVMEFWMEILTKLWPSDEGSPNEWTLDVRSSTCSLVCEFYAGWGPGGGSDSLPDLMEGSNWWEAESLFHSKHSFLRFEVEEICASYGFSSDWTEACDMREANFEMRAERFRAQVATPKDQRASLILTILELQPIALTLGQSRVIPDTAATTAGLSRVWEPEDG